MFCNKCNAPVENDVRFCTNCGNDLNSVQEKNVNDVSKDNAGTLTQDKVNIWWVLLSWFVPIAGIVVFFVQKKSSPKTAKASGICALISLILSIIIVILVFGLIFGFGFYASNKVLEETKDIVDKVIDTGEIVDDELNDESEEDKNNSSDQVQTDDVKDNVNDAQSDNSMNVSNDWRQYQFGIFGKVYSLPVAYNELATATGFSLKPVTLNNSLANNYYSPVNMYKNDKLALYVEIMNKTGADAKYSDCNVTRISQTKYQVSQGADHIVFPGNIKAGDSITEEKIISLFGTPNEIKENGTSKQYSFLSDTTWTTINNFKIKVVDGIVDEIALDHRG